MSKSVTIKLPRAPEFVKRFRHWAAVPIDKATERHVKHRNLWFIIHFGFPITWSVLMVMAANTQYAHLWRRFFHESGWGFGLYFMAMLTNWVVINMLWKHRNKFLFYYANHTDIEMLEVEDRGEMLEAGPDWRRIRFTTAKHRGHGRLRETTIGWSEWLANPPTREIKPLAFSDPEIESFLRSNVEFGCASVEVECDHPEHNAE